MILLNLKMKNWEGKKSHWGNRLRKSLLIWFSRLSLGRVKNETIVKSNFREPKVKNRLRKR